MGVLGAQHDTEQGYWPSLPVTRISAAPSVRLGTSPRAGIVKTSFSAVSVSIARRTVPPAHAVVLLQVAL